MRNPPLQRVRAVGSNMTEVEHGDALILVSYATPVAVFIPGKGPFRTDQTFSATTSKHIGKWVREQFGYESRKVPTLPQDTIEYVFRHGALPNPGEHGELAPDPRSGVMAGSPGLTGRVGQYTQPVGGSPGRTPNPRHVRSPEYLWAAGDVGCYIDGEDHAVARMRDLLREVAQAYPIYPIGAAARELLQEEEEELEEEFRGEWLDDATDNVLQEATAPGLVWIWEVGDLCLLDESELEP